MKKSNKKGFTIVELVIVIAVIAILAAVLIPTFSSLVKKANLSSDKQAVRNMNMALAADEAKNGKPANLRRAHEILSAAGYNDTLMPVTANHDFKWSKQYNIVMLVDVSDNSNWKLVYPTDDPDANALFDSNFTEVFSLSYYENDTVKKVDDKLNAIKSTTDKTLVISADVSGENTITFSDIVLASYKGGESFEGITIKIPDDVASVSVNVADVGRFNKFEGTIDGNNKKIILSGIQAVHDITGANEEAKNASGYLYYNNVEAEEKKDGTTVNVKKEKVGTAFINYLGTGAVVKNLNIEYAQSSEDRVDPHNVYTYFGGIVGCLDGGTIENCTVTGYIKQYNRIGGIVGTALSGEIKNCTIGSESTPLTIESKMSDSSELAEKVDDAKHYCTVGGVVAYVGNGRSDTDQLLKISGCKVNLKVVGKVCGQGAIAGWVSGASSNKKSTKVDITNCTIWGMQYDDFCDKDRRGRIIGTAAYDITIDDVTLRSAINSCKDKNGNAISNTYDTNNGWYNNFINFIAHSDIAESNKAINEKFETLK